MSVAKEGNERKLETSKDDESQFGRVYEKSNCVWEVFPPSVLALGCLVLVREKFYDAEAV